MINRANAASAIALSLAASAVTNGAAQGTMNTLTAAEKAAGWRLLFDGTTTAGWRGYKQSAVPTGWSVVDGTLTKTGPAGDIITREKYRDFELEVDWKISTGGNSGIFYRGTEEYDHIYWSAPEFQLLDDAHAPDGKSRLTSAGADYALFPSPAGIVKPAGEWYHTRIVVRGRHVEHWLNGKKLLSYELESPDWDRRVKGSKLAAWPNYGKASDGYIGIQGDHPGTLTLRNIKIRTLP